MKSSGLIQCLLHLIAIQCLFVCFCLVNFLLAECTEWWRKGFPKGKSKIRIRRVSENPSDFRFAKKKLSDSNNIQIQIGTPTRPYYNQHTGL